MGTFLTLKPGLRTGPPNCRKNAGNAVTLQGPGSLSATGSFQLPSGPEVDPRLCLSSPAEGAVEAPPPEPHCPSALLCVESTDCRASLCSPPFPLTWRQESPGSQPSGLKRPLPSSRLSCPLCAHFKPGAWRGWTQRAPGAAQVRAAVNTAPQMREPQGPQRC